MYTDHNILSNKDNNMFSSILTGNTMIDMAIIGAITTLITKLVNDFAAMILAFTGYINTCFPNFAIMKQFFKSRYYGKNTGELYITMTSTTTSSGDSFSSSTNYKSILHQLKKRNIFISSLKDCTSSKSIFDYWDIQYKLEDTTKDNNYIINDSNEIEICSEDKIYISCYVLSENIDSEKNKTIINRNTIKMYSKKLKVYDLLNTLEKWNEDYSKYLRDKLNDDKQYYFYISSQWSRKSKHQKDDDENLQLAHTLWSMQLMKSSKRFDNIFFPGKDEFKKRVDYFIDNEKEYNRLGIPYTFGILLYGEPGCGKTSTIKALANYTNRHVVEINLAKIKSCQDFRNAFYNNNICNYYVPIDKKIIVLEDIDCMIDIIKQRSENNENDNENDLKSKDSCESSVSSNEDTFGKMIAKHLIDKDYEANGDLTLSFILNILDGVLEQHGRILIISTNYKDKLDSALIRPGRIDYKLNFTKCTKDTCIDIIEHYINKKISKSRDNIDIPDNKYTPAEIFEYCLNFRNENDIMNFLINSNNMNHSI